MRTTIIALALGLVIASAPNAHAQLWTDPSGRFTLDYASLGWESVQREGPEYLRLESTTAREREKFLTCTARVLGPLPNSLGIDQAQVNLRSRQFGPDNLRAAIPEAQDIRVEHSSVDGVELIDLRFLTSSHGGLHFHWRTFFLSTPEGVVQHQIQCGGTMPVRPQDDAEIDAVLATLRFVSMD